MGNAYFEATGSDYISKSQNEVLGQLARNHHHALEDKQRFAREKQIEIMRPIMAEYPKAHLYSEFSIPRMGKRADVILIIQSVIFVIEFKVNSKDFDKYALDQAHDYALDLKNFYRGSHAEMLVPIVVATQASTYDFSLNLAADQVAAPLQCSGTTLLSCIASVLSVNLNSAQAEINVLEWSGSGYLPTPTIIEAATALYQNHDARDISRSDAGAINLQATSDRIREIIDYARAHKTKAICFVTGVPGAGKTLAGLNIAAEQQKNHEDDHAVFLSGNGPLVDVLREALTRDETARKKIKKTDSARAVKKFIQNIHHFRDEYLKHLTAPIEHVVVFDEAQRAWTLEQASKFMRDKRGQEGFSQSEPEFLIRVMDRHEDWGVIVCLIGGGQEINTGEAGMLGWLTALKDHFSHWKIYVSDQLLGRHYTADPQARAILATPDVQKYPELHLAVSMRSFRAETLAHWVEEVLDGDATHARSIHENLSARYPVIITRDIERGRDWLRAKARANERFGMLANSGAIRLRPEGINVKANIEPAQWFLNDKYDVRSSYYLEDVGTEFAVQGLELDWTLVGWDGDLRRVDDAWTHFSFKGSKWQNVNQEERRRYLENAYRVLLTRARQGMVIFVPKGDNRDHTRPPDFYDETYAFLKSCGLTDI